MTSNTSARRVLDDLADGTRPFTAADEHPHPAFGSATWAETSWWVFTSPDTSLIGWVYVLTRQAMDVASVGVWIWDDTASEPRELLHSRFYAHAALPAGYDLAALRLLDGGLEIDMIDPLRSYELRYTSGDTTVTLTARGLIPPQPLGIGEATGHADQPLWFNGTVSIGDRTIAIDGPGLRDRTWSERPETSIGTRNCYSWTTGRDRGFQLLSLLDDDTEEAIFVGGYLWWDDEIAPLTRCRRTVDERGADGRPARITIQLEDALGREITAHGTCSSTAALAGFTGHLTWATLVAWDVDGDLVWGEDHDSWTHERWRDRRHSTS